MECTIWNTVIHVRYQIIITGNHEALTEPLFHSALDHSGVWSREELECKARHLTRSWLISGLQNTTQPMTKAHTIDPDEFKTTSITSNSCNRPPDTGEIATAPISLSNHCGNLESSDTKWCTRQVTDFEDNDHKFNPISVSQLGTFTSPSTYNRLSNLTPKRGHIENRSEVWRFTSQHSYDYISFNSAKCTYLGLYTYGQTTETNNLHKERSLYQSSTRTGINVCTSKVHFLRRYPELEGYFQRHYIAQRGVHIRSNTGATPQTIYDDYNDDNDYNYFNDCIYPRVEVV